jgi:hypothetical protein
MSMAPATGWNHQVAPETDADLRQILKSQGDPAEAEQQQACFWQVDFGLLKIPTPDSSE